MEKEFYSLEKALQQPEAVCDLNLWGKNIKEIPDQLGQLTHLKKLTITHTGLTTLPAVLGELKQLQYLNLRNNQLTSLPPQIGQLPQLVNLDLRFNALQQLPDTIGQLSGLQMLNLSGNQLVSLPAQVGQLTELTHLDLRNNLFATFPSAVFPLPNLQQVDLQDNPIVHVGAEVGQMLSPRLYIKWPRTVQPRYQEIDRMIRRFNRENTPEKLRIVSCLLYLKELQQARDWLAAHFTIPELLSLLDTPDVRLRKTVQVAVRDQLPYPFEKPATLTQCIFYVGGKLEILTLAELTQWLETAGAQVVDRLDKRVTHVVVENGAGATLVLAHEQNARLVFENDFVGWLESEEKPFLREEGPEAKHMRDSVRALLFNNQPENVMIGLQTMVGGGVPTDLLGVVLGLFMCHPDVDIRVTAGQLFRKYTSLSLQAHVRAYWRTNYSDSPAEAIRQGYLEDVLAHDEVDKVGLVRIAVQLTGEGEHLLSK